MGKRMNAYIIFVLGKGNFSSPNMCELHKISEHPKRDNRRFKKKEII